MTGKILIKCDLVVRTGLHIGGSSSFSAIGTVDSPVIRDPFTGLPIVPGSSLKGKLRTLLARRSCVNGETLPDFSADGEVLLRMFGGSEPVRFARLQFADAFLLNYDQLKGVGVTEVKSENTRPTLARSSALLPVPGSGSTSFTTCPTPKRWKRTFRFCPRP